MVCSSSSVIQALDEELVVVVELHSARLNTEPPPSDASHTELSSPPTDRILPQTTNVRKASLKFRVRRLVVVKEGSVRIQSNLEAPLG